MKSECELRRFHSKILTTWQLFLLFDARVLKSGFANASVHVTCGDLGIFDFWLVEFLSLEYQMLRESQECRFYNCFFSEMMLLGFYILYCTNTKAVFLNVLKKKIRLKTSRSRDWWWNAPKHNDSHRKGTYSYKIVSANQTCMNTERKHKSAKAKSSESSFTA